MKLIIDISEEDMDKVRHSDNAIFYDVYRMMANIIQHGIPIHDNATNGEVIKTMFPNALRSDYIENDMVILYLQDENENEMVVSEDWWFAPWQKVRIRNDRVKAMSILR